MSFGFFLGFITAYMIFKIRELEFQNKILEQRIIQESNRNNVKRKKDEAIKEEKKDEENKEEEEDKKEENKKDEEEKKENDEKAQMNTIENIIKEEPKKQVFKPPEIRERKVQEEEWTEIKRKGKKKKP